MIHSHKLSSKNKKHKSFLEEERKDPITGDKIIEGNEIVLCGACKSAFLLDSWNYMACSHCNQPFTLKEIPAKQHVVKESIVETEVEYKFKVSPKSSPDLIVLVFFVVQILTAKLFVFLLNNKMGTTAIILLLFTIFTPVLYHFFQSNKKIKISSLKLVISSLLNTKSIYLSKIEKLEFFDSSKDGKTVSLIMFLMNGKIKRFKIIKDKHTISEVKDLKEYFEKNNLSDKISLV